MNTITITGRPYSKKNSRQARRARSKTGKLYMYMAAGDNYESFKLQALYQLKAIKHKFTGPIAIDYVFYKKGRELQDIDNAICSINDVLQDAGIIDNDKNIFEGSFKFKFNNGDWKTEVSIQKLEEPL